MKLRKMSRRCLLGCFAARMSVSFTSAVAFAASPAADTATITILGTSDVHGRFMPWDYATDTENRDGSLAQISTAVNEIRKENPNVILVDAGDAIQDNSVEQFNKEKHQPMVVAMNAMGYDIWEMGNHEFNFGLDVLRHVRISSKDRSSAAISIGLTAAALCRRRRLSRKAACASASSAWIRR